LLGCVVVLAAPPVSASAATIAARQANINGTTGLWTFFDAASGERNAVRVTPYQATLESQWLETRAPLTVVRDCSAFGEGAAVCPHGPIQMRLGDAADVARVDLRGFFDGAANESLLLFADDGADDVVASVDFGTFDGGSGDDRMQVSGEFLVRVFGGPGRDVIRGGPGAREIAGGSGGDFITVEERIGGFLGEEGSDMILLPPTTASDGLAGATGDAGNDLLFVAAGGPRDELPPERDEYFAWGLYGGAGNDVLFGGINEDFFDAGAGNDVVVSRDGVREEVQCGDGFDVAVVDADDIATACEAAIHESAEDTFARRTAVQRALRGSPVAVRRTLLGATTD
jgi:Ca2+-binding RTX toxin-like protein